MKYLAQNLRLIDTHYILGTFIPISFPIQAQYLDKGIGYPLPSPAYLPDPGIELGSPALQVDSLPTELSGKPRYGIELLFIYLFVCTFIVGFLIFIATCGIFSCGMQTLSCSMRDLVPPWISSLESWPLDQPGKSHRELLFKPGNLTSQEPQTWTRKLSVH